MKWKPYFLVVALQSEGKIKKGVVPTVTYVVESPAKYNQHDSSRDNEREAQLEIYILLGAYSILRPCLRQESAKIIIEMLNNKLHVLSPPGGFVSPSGRFASLLFDQAVPKNSQRHLADRNATCILHQSDCAWLCCLLSQLQ